MTTLVIAEHNHKSISQATRSTITAAKQIGSDIDLLIAGNACAEAVEDASKVDGIRKVLKVEDDVFSQPLAENYANLLVQLSNKYAHMIVPATAFGKDFMPRASALLDTQQISDIIEVVAQDTFIRPIYAGNALLKVRSNDALKCITVRPTSFEPASDGGNTCAVEDVTFDKVSNLSSFISLDVKVSERPELTSARVVVSGGRGVGSAENFDILFKLADKLQAAVGASRAAVDAGYISNNFQVGQTGKVVAPDIYFAIGISGAIQHLAGMKDSKIVVAINLDEEAPIFNIADYGLCADLFEAVPELTAALD